MLFSLRPLDEIAALLAEHAAAPERRLAQRALADEITALVHGPEAADAAGEAADVLFGGDPLRRLGGVAGDGGPRGPVQRARSRGARRRRRAPRGHGTGHVEDAMPGASCSRASVRANGRPAVP